MPGGGFIDLTITDANGLALMRRRVATWELRLNDLSEPLTQVGLDWQDEFTANFVSQGGVYAGGWAPLAPSTVQQKARLGYGGGTLVRTGELFDSVTRRGAPGNVFNVTPRSVEVGSNNFKAAIHQHGAPRAHIPARPIIGLSWNMKQLVVRRFNDWVQRLLNS
jgi:phage gpG-like protein